MYFLMRMYKEMQDKLKMHNIQQRIEQCSRHKTDFRHNDRIFMQQTSELALATFSSS
jgi:hypothetical protein